MLPLRKSLPRGAADGKGEPERRGGVSPLRSCRHAGVGRFVTGFRNGSCSLSGGLGGGDVNIVRHPLRNGARGRALTWHAFVFPPPDRGDVDAKMFAKLGLGKAKALAGFDELSGCDHALLCILRSSLSTPLSEENYAFCIFRC